MKWLMLAVIIFAQQPAKTPEGKGATQPKIAQSAEQTSKTDHGSGQPQSPVSVTVNTSLPSPNSDSSKEQTEENMRVQRRLTLYTGLLVIAGFVTAALIWWQAKKTAEATKAMQDSLPHQETAARAAKASADALTNAERAWLTAQVENFGEPPPSVHLIWIEIPIKNSGRTPARLKQIKVTSKLVPFPQNGWGRPGPLPDIPEFFDETRLVELRNKDIVIAPGDTFRHMHVYISPNELKEVRERKQSLYVYGMIEYGDTLTAECHKTDFCSIYWVPEANFGEPTGFMFSQVIPDAYFSAT